MSDISTTEGASAPQAERKPYRRPEILSRERLEALAIVCDPPSKTDVVSCPSGQITS